MPGTTPTLPPYGITRRLTPPGLASISWNACACTNRASSRPAGPTTPRRFPATLRLTPPPDRIDALHADYEAMQQMSIGQRMPFEDMLATLKEAETVLNRS